LGQTAPNPVLSTLRHFRQEYEAHIVERRCPAHACQELAPTACTSACPAHVNIPEYVALIAEGRFADALEVVRRRNPLAAVCGRACHHPCEMFCRRGDVDESVSIRHLKRFVTDRARDTAAPPQWQGPRSGRVAVVGSGPAGLTAAYFLALMGREVTVFEALDVVGGMLAVGVPEYRLPRNVLSRDIEYIRRAGVEIKTGQRIDSLRKLREQGFQAIFVATGAHGGVRLDVPGAGLEGVHDAIALLRKVTLGEIKKLEGRAVVIGGGNAAIDAARAALRLGAQSVTILYRRTREEMPAIREEIEEALLEGVDIRYLVAPLAIEGDGRVRAIRCQEMMLGEADAGGRRRPVPKPGAKQTFECEQVIVAIGQAPELEFAVAEGSLVVSKGVVKADPLTLRAGDGIFVGGDVATGPATIVEAVAAGQRAAQAIDVFLGGKGELPPDVGFASPGKPSESEAQTAPRQPVRARPPARRRGNFDEVVKGYSVQAACAEARRCLRCDLE
jgi:NADH-quinone oxidoreductase subunit F